MMIEHNSCGAVDEYGHEISCSECINDGRCQQSMARCAHRFDILDPRCRICSGVSKGECASYEPERSCR